MHRLTALTYMLLALTGCSSEEPALVGQPLAPAYVGSENCGDCHTTEFEQWQGSHHELAMQEASRASMLGDFSGRVIEHSGSKVSMYSRDDRFFYGERTAEGEQREFEITHTFGVYPLQQYLVSAPGGRKQALQVAWDARPEADGGQRWYHLYPDEYIGPDDPLHWSGRYFNWNFTCAECHSTNVRLGYDIATDSFATSFDEISVGCEACHGPGRTHVAQANDAAFDERYGLSVRLGEAGKAAWVMDPESGIARRSLTGQSPQQPESCGRCHSRRTTIAEDYEHGKALTDTHMPSLLEDQLYHADGRILDEVYVYGSFLQSKMYAAGVTCSDCHNPHSAKLHAGPEPNDTCAQCHLPAKFATAGHSERQVGDCVGCHMPATTYMGVDDRRDHSFRIPDAGESADHYGQLIAAGRAGGANARLLDGIGNASYPAIARATLLTLLEPVQDAAPANLILEQLDDQDPLVRIAALRNLRRQPAELAMRSGSHLLRDPVRGVRTEAALTFLDYRDLLPAEDARAYAAAADEYRAALRLNASQPQPALQLAEFESRLGKSDAAERMYEHALRLDPRYALARHSYGLFLIRTNRHADALPELAQAAELDAQTERFAYVYGVALNSMGHGDRALDVLRQAYERFPDSFDIGWALATMLRDTGDAEAARQLALELQDAHPERENVDALLRSLSP
ncbi:MAG: tetratricopeptide repeat protein [Pseudomonadota bacterium]